MWKKAQFFIVPGVHGAPAVSQACLRLNYSMWGMDDNKEIKDFETFYFNTDLKSKWSWIKLNPGGGKE